MFLSSGKLVKNPQLIRRYVDEARKRGIDLSKVLPNEEDIDLVRNVSMHALDMLKIMEDLIQRFMKRIDPGIAREVFKEVLNEDVDEATATYLLAKEFSAWTLEIAEALNLIKIDEKIG
ncbi:MAG: hypothetical protein QW632_03360 [Ignisphaera sp.]